jgi:polygalacturonase
MMFSKFKTFLWGAVFILISSTAWSLNCTANRAVANHSQNVSGSIQNCINSVHNSGGGTVNLTSGTYRTAGSIILKSNVVLKGAGITSTKIEYNGNGAHDILTNNGYAVHDVTIRDLKIWGSGQWSGDNQACILITDSHGGTNQEIYLRYVKAEYCPQYGVHIKGADGVHLMYPQLRRNGSDWRYDHNLYFRRVENAKIELGYSNGSAGNGLNFTECENIVVRNFDTKYNGQNGIRFAASEYVKVYRGDASDNNENGIEFRTEGSDSRHVCVKETDIKYNDHYGIFMRTAKRYQFSNNSLYSNASGAIYNHQGWSNASNSSCASIPTNPNVYPF